MDQTPEGYDEPKQRTRAEMMEEAWRAEQAMMADSYGDGQRAVFGAGDKKQTRAEARVQRRMEMLDRLGAAIASRMAEQFSSLPSAIAEAIKGLDNRQSQPAEQFKSAQLREGEERFASPSHVARQRPDVPLSRQQHVASAEAGWQPSTTERAPQRVEMEDPDIRPAVLRDYPVDRLPASPAGLPKATPMRSLDDEPQSAAAPTPEIPRASFRTEQARVEARQETRQPRTAEVRYEPMSAAMPRMPQVHMDPIGRPTPEIAGGQTGAMEELVREVAESNQQFHAAMTMFVRMIVEAHHQTTEEIYQAMTALDRQEGPR